MERLHRALGRTAFVALALSLGACEAPEPDDDVTLPPPPPHAPPDVTPPDTPPPLAPGPGPQPAEPPDAAETMTVQVHFTRNERQEPLPREVPRAPAVLQAALEAQLRGPTAEERAAGFSSWFSDATAGMLRRVVLDAGGRAVVDFHDLSATIPGASSAAGSEVLLGELNRTVFQFGTVRSVEYRMEGSCDRFWNWLQRECQVVERPGP